MLNMIDGVEADRQERGSEPRPKPGGNAEKLRLFVRGTRQDEIHGAL